jgi:hypothetical protein
MHNNNDDQLTKALLARLVQITNPAAVLAEKVDEIRDDVAGNEDNDNPQRIATLEALMRVWLDLRAAATAATAPDKRGNLADAAANLRTALKSYAACVNVSSEDDLRDVARDLAAIRRAVKA